VGRYLPEKTEKLSADVAIILVPLSDAQNSLKGDFDQVTINGDYYALQLIDSSAQYKD
jgi:hypothetical protein